MESCSTPRKYVEVGEKELKCSTSVVENFYQQKMYNVVWTIEDLEKLASFYSNKGESVKFRCGRQELRIGKCTSTWTLDLTFQSKSYFNVKYPDTSYESYEDICEYNFEPRINCFKQGDTDIDIMDGEIFLINADDGETTCGMKFGNNWKPSWTFGYIRLENEDGWWYPHVSSHFISNKGSLVVSMNVVLRTVVPKSKANSYPVPIVEEKKVDEKHVERMKKMLVNASSCFSDITLVCSDGSIPCHAAILATGSSFFQEKLGAEESKRTEIEMEDLSMEKCFILLEFIYTNKIDSNNIDLQILQHSVTYGIYNLREQCSPHLARQIDSDTCLDTLILADKISDGDLKTAAKNYILSNNVDTKKLQTHPHLLYELLTERMSSQN